MGVRYGSGRRLVRPFTKIEHRLELGVLIFAIVWGIIIVYSIYDYHQGG